MSLFDDFFSDDDQDSNRKLFGITTGTVKENWESKHPGMVKVEFFLGEKGKTVTDWVRVAQPYAGKDYGAYLLPEVGDEVVLSFNMGDVNRPYVIGSLWNNKDKIPDKTANKDNNIKRIKTKGGHEIIFGEEKKKETLEIHTPGKLKILLEDEKKNIVIQDENGDNMLQIDGKNGKIIVQAKSSICLNAGSGASVLELDGKGKKATLKADSVTVEAKQALTLKGQNLKVDGNMVEMKGKGSFKVQSSAMLELKGSMTKIN